MPTYKGPGLRNAVGQATGEPIWKKREARLLERLYGTLKEYGGWYPFEIRRCPAQTDVTVLQVNGMKTTLFAWPEGGGWRIETHIPWDEA